MFGMFGCPNSVTAMGHGTITSSPGLMTRLALFWWKSNGTSFSFTSFTKSGIAGSPCRCGAGVGMSVVRERAPPRMSPQWGSVHPASPCTAVRAGDVRGRKLGSGASLETDHDGRIDVGEGRVVGHRIDGATEVVADVDAIVREGRDDIEVAGGGGRCRHEVVRRGVIGRVVQDQADALLADTHLRARGG